MASRDERQALRQLGALGRELAGLARRHRPAVLSVGDRLDAHGLAARERALRTSASRSAW